MSIPYARVSLFERKTQKVIEEHNFYNQSQVDNFHFWWNENGNQIEYGTKTLYITPDMADFIREDRKLEAQQEKAFDLQNDEEEDP